MSKVESTTLVSWLNLVLSKLQQTLWHDVLPSGPSLKNCTHVHIHICVWDVCMHTFFIITLYITLQQHWKENKEENVSLKTLTIVIWCIFRGIKWNFALSREISLAIIGWGCIWEIKCPNSFQKFDFISMWLYFLPQLCLCALKAAPYQAGLLVIWDLLILHLDSHSAFCLFSSLIAHPSSGWASSISWDPVSHLLFSPSPFQNSLPL